MRADLFLLGCVRYRVPASSQAALFSLLHEGGFSPKGLERCEKTGDVTFSLFAFTARRFEREASEVSLCFSGEKEVGVPFLFARLTGRAGLIAGVVLGLALFICSSLFVWDVRVQGCGEIPQEELEQELAAAGLFRGSFLPRLDTKEICLALRRGDARVAYVAVNVVGTVAYVQVRESEPEPEHRALLPANLLATCDGVITLPLVFEGECLVREGEVVRAGQLLASGVLDTKNGSYRVTRAAGQVLAKTTHTYTVTVPFNELQKTYTGNERREVTLYFFQYARKVFKSTGKDIGECDIIDTIQWWSTPTGKRLPIGYAVRRSSEYVMTPVQHTAAAARALANDRLEALLAADSAGRTLLQRTVETRMDADGVTLVCTVVCEENIARTVEFGLE